MDICCNVRLAYSSLCTVCVNAGKTEEEFFFFFPRSSNMEHMAKILSTWIEDQEQCHVPVSAFG